MDWKALAVKLGKVIAVSELRGLPATIVFHAIVEEDEMLALISAEKEMGGQEPVATERPKGFHIPFRW